MKIGQKSLLIGAHQFIIHPTMLAIAWTKLYGFPWDFRLWVSFIIHDWGYWNCSDMDGAEGKQHPYLGANIMHFLFDRYESVEHVNCFLDGCIAHVDARANWDRWSLCSMGCCVHRMERSTHWLDFTLFHSRTIAKWCGVPHSRLCVADKYVFCIEPWWLYLPRVVLSGEIHEYLEEARKGLGKDYTGNLRLWHKDVRAHLLNWVMENR